MPIVLPSSDVAEELRRLEDELRTAELARVTPADQRAAELRAQLEEKKAEWRAQQACEGEAIAEHARQQQLALLAETEKAIDRTKAETVALRRTLAELPGRLAATEYQLSQLLRSHANLKADLAI